MKMVNQLVTNIHQEHGVKYRMLNTQVLKGWLRNIQPSHKIKDIEYDQADIIACRPDGKEDIITIKFKKYSNKYREGDFVELKGQLRSFSQKITANHNKVSLYVFTYFDIPDRIETNHFQIDGRICKIDRLRYTKNNKESIHFILANNLMINNDKQKLNSYLPCVAWGNLAKELAKLAVNDQIKIEGELHSREYKKMLSEDEFEFRVAHELVISSFEVIE